MLLEDCAARSSSRELGSGFQLSERQANTEQILALIEIDEHLMHGNGCHETHDKCSPGDNEGPTR